MKSISLKTKIISATLAVVALCFILSGIFSIEATKKQIKGTLINSSIEEAKQIAHQAEILLSYDEDDSKLQDFIEETATNTQIAYAVIIDTNVSALAHSDVEKIGKSYSDDEYTVDGAKNGQIKTSRFYADVQKCWTYDIMVPILHNGQLYGALDIGIYETNISSIIKPLAITQIISLIVAIFCITLFILWLFQKLFDLFKHIASQFDLLAQGDFSTSIPENLLNRQDELGMVYHSIHRIHCHLEKVIKDTCQLSEHINQISKEITTNASTTQGAASEISSSMDQVSISAEEQTHLSNDTSEITTEIHKGMERVTESIQNVTYASTDMLNGAEKGNEVILLVINQMNSINEKVNLVATQIQNLEKQSNEIQNIITIITDIAKQTNLLALNAAIEAARAGDQGRGFSVVAEQVRQLAEQSSKSALQIGAIISDIHQNVEAVTHSISESTSTVSEGLSLAAEAGTSFKNILGHIHQVSTEMDEVSAISEEVNASTSNVLNSVENIASISQTTQDVLQAISTSAHEQTELMEQVASDVATLSHFANDLSEQMASFKFAETEH